MRHRSWRRSCLDYKRILGEEMRRLSSAKLSHAPVLDPPYSLVMNQISQTTDIARVRSKAHSLLAFALRAGPECTLDVGGDGSTSSSFPISSPRPAKISSAEPLNVI